MVIVWSLLTWVCSSASVNIDSSVISESMGVFNFGVAAGVVEAVLYVFAGWLADVYVGRYKVMKVSIWFMWMGSVGGTLLLMIHLLSPHDALKYVSVVVAYACAIIGSTGLIVNVVPFGTDQMLGASSEEISGFVHWFVWAYYTGQGSGYMVSILSCTVMEGDQTILVSMLFAAYFLDQDLVQ